MSSKLGRNHPKAMTAQNCPHLDQPVREVTKTLITLQNWESYSGQQGWLEHKPYPESESEPPEMSKTAVEHRPPCRGTENEVYTP